MSSFIWAALKWNHKLQEHSCRALTINGWNLCVLSRAQQSCTTYYCRVWNPGLSEQLRALLSCITLLALAGDRAGRCDSRAKGAPDPSGWEGQARQDSSGCRGECLAPVQLELSVAAGYCQWDVFQLCCLAPTACAVNLDTHTWTFKVRVSVVN